ncbi:unnamed protein product, partial [marine sediment metagenome]
IQAAPVIIGGKSAISKSPQRIKSKIDGKTSLAIKRGINKSIRPSVAKKGTSSQ